MPTNLNLKLTLSGLLAGYLVLHGGYEQAHVGETHLPPPGRRTRATVAQLEAIFGWSGGGMASLYTRLADRQRLAKDAMHTLGGNRNTTAKDAPDGKCGPETIKLNKINAEK